MFVWKVAVKFDLSVDLMFSPWAMEAIFGFVVFAAMNPWYPGM
jgi:hypothetical protein